MNIIKKVVVFVMGLVVIGVVATTIGVVTQTKNVEKSVTFELLENNELAFNVYDTINEYVVTDDEDRVTNLVSISVNNDNNIFVDTIINATPYGVEIVEMPDDIPSINIYPNNTYDYYGLNIGDIISITFEVEQETPAIIKALLFLTPLILSASLIGYLTFKKGDE